MDYIRIDYSRHSGYNNTNGENQKEGENHIAGVNRKIEDHIRDDYDCGIIAVGCDSRGQSAHHIILDNTHLRRNSGDNVLGNWHPLYN